MAAADSPLAGARVLVTRPAHQAESLCKKIEAAGGEAIRFPTLAIADPVDDTALAQSLMLAAQADWAIFISPNAVARGLPLLHAHRPNSNLRYAAVGAATSQALHAAGIPAVLVPTTRFDSESLLELLPASLVNGKSILLFRGDGGRTLLADTLTARGAQVVHAVCYRRTQPVADQTVLRRLRHGEIDVTITTSTEGLENLLAMTPDDAGRQLRQRGLVVTSSRQRDIAQTLGFSGPVIAATNTEDDSVLDALRAWREGQNSL